MANPVIRVDGYQELLRACNNASDDTKRFVKDALADAGEPVRSNAATFFTGVPGAAATVAGFKSTATVEGVRVYQRKKKVTGKHPEYGALQMRVLWKAAHLEAANTERLLEDALDKIARHFERGH